MYEAKGILHLERNMLNCMVKSDKPIICRFGRVGSLGICGLFVLVVGCIGDGNNGLERERSNCCLISSRENPCERLLWPDMVRIPKTKFLMGSPVNANRLPAYRSVERPQRYVVVNEFCLGKFLEPIPLPGLTA